MPLQKSPQAHTIGADEHTYMEWFVCRTAKKLPGAFDSSFWTTLLLQASCSEDAVLHAVLTLASVHRSEVSNLTSTKSNTSVATDVFTLQQCDRAITQLRKHISDRSNDSRTVALIVCAVFVHLESFRGCYQTALTHLRHGLGLLHEISTKNEDIANGFRSQSEYRVVGIFRHLYIQAKLLGQDTFYSWPASLLPQSNRIGAFFESVHHARQTLEFIFIRTFDHIDVYNLESPSHSSLSSRNLCKTHLRIDSDLSTWFQAHHESTKSDSAVLTLPTDPVACRDLVAWHVLHIYATLLDLILTDNSSTLYPTNSAPSFASSDTTDSPNSFSHSTYLTTTSRSHDLHQPIIKQTLHLASLASAPALSHLRNHDPHRLLPLHKPAFDTSRQLNKRRGGSIADIGPIPPLYYIVVHSHDHEVRQKGIELLEYLMHKEGLWDADIAVVVARRVMELDCDADARVGISQVSNVDGKEPGVCGERIDRWQGHGRVKDVRITLPEEAMGTIGLTYARDRMGAVGGLGPETAKEVYDMKTKRWLQQ